MKQTEAERELRDATTLAYQGMYKCRMCHKIAPQGDGVVISFAGNVLLAVCPECITGPIILRRDGGYIHIDMPKPKDNRVILTSGLATSQGLVTARPDVEVTKL